MFREFGRISYCLYLIHEAVHFLCDILLRTALKKVESWEGIAMAGVALILSCAIAEASWAYFEHPLLRYGHRYGYSPASIADSRDALSRPAPVSAVST